MKKPKIFNDASISLMMIGMFFLDGYAGKNSTKEEFIEKCKHIKESGYITEKQHEICLKAIDEYFEHGAKVKEIIRGVLKND